MDISREGECINYSGWSEYSQTFSVAASHGGVTCV